MIRNITLWQTRDGPKALSQTVFEISPETFSTISTDWLKLKIFQFCPYFSTLTSWYRLFDIKNWLQLSILLYYYKTRCEAMNPPRSPEVVWRSLALVTNHQNEKLGFLSLFLLSPVLMTIIPPQDLRRLRGLHNFTPSLIIQLAAMNKT